MFNLGKKSNGKNPADLKDVNNEIIKIKKENEKIKQEIKEIKKKQESCIQKMGIVRFNPFKGEGGNQSFSIALLNDQDNGFVITTLYSKEGSRVYGKEIKEGKSEHALSEEEKEAILKTNKKDIENKKK